MNVKHRTLHQIWTLCEVMERTTPSEATALFALVSGPLKLSDLGEQIHLSRAATTTLSDRLENGGYAERRPEPSDRRIILLHLTDKGFTAVTDALYLAEQRLKDEEENG